MSAACLSGERVDVAQLTEGIRTEAAGLWQSLDPRDRRPADRSRRGRSSLRASGLHGVGLFILVGAVAGAVVLLLFRVYYGNIGLDERKITIPQLSELHFTVSPDNRLVAWRLYIETTTRVSTQPLAEGTGNLREAIEFSLQPVQAVRTSLKEARPSRAGWPGRRSRNWGWRCSTCSCVPSCPAGIHCSLTGNAATPASRSGRGRRP